MVLLGSGFVRLASRPVESGGALGGGWAVAPAVLGCGSGSAAARLSAARRASMRLG